LDARNSTRAGRERWQTVEKSAGKERRNLQGHRYR